MEFEWDERKNVKNIGKHDLSFITAARLLRGKDCLVLRSDYSEEERFIAIGKISERYVTVVYTMRLDVVKIISARSARSNEKESYERGK